MVAGNVMLGVLALAVLAWVFRCEIGRHPHRDRMMSTGRRVGQVSVAAWSCRRCGRSLHPTVLPVAGTTAEPRRQPAQVRARARGRVVPWPDRRP